MSGGMKPVKGIIDRFEEECAVVETEDRQMIVIERRLLPPEAQEGDVLVFSEGKYQIDRVETKRLKEAIAKQTKDLWE